MSTDSSLRPGNDVANTLTCGGWMRPVFVQPLVIVIVALFLSALSNTVTAQTGTDLDDLNRRIVELYRTGNYQEAIPLAERAAEATKKAVGEDHPDYAASLNNLAGLYHSTGDNARAEPLARQAMEIVKRALGEDHPDYATSLSNLAQLYGSIGDYTRAEPLHRQALEIRKNTLGEDHPDYARSLLDLAELYRSIGDHTQAEPLYRQTLELRKRTLGEDHPNYAASLNDLAGVYFHMGDYARAEPLYRQVLEIAKKTLGEDHANYATTLSNLAELYVSIGDYTRAEPLHRQALEIRKKTLGEDHPHYARSLHDLAELYGSIGEYQWAEPLYRRALEIRKRAVGEDHPHYAASLNKLAGVYFRMGDYARAEPLYHQVLEITKKALGEEHPNYATALSNLAELYVSIGDYTQAEPLHRQALETRKKTLGEDHPDYVASLHDLAALHQSMGEYARAAPLLEQLLEIQKRVLGEDHPDYATSLNILAVNYHLMGDYARAEPLHRRAAEIRKTALGEDHPDYATSLNNLGGVYESMGDYARAEPLHRRAVEIHKKVLGEAHPEYAASSDNLAGLYYSMGDYARAEPMHRQALEIRKKALGEDHPAYAGSLHNLGGLYYAMGDYARAEPLFRRALKIKKKALGEDHPDYATSLNNLSLVYRFMGDYARSRSLLRQALEIRKKALGEDHPAYATSLNNMAGLYYSMGDYARAEPLFHQALEINKKARGEEHPEYARVLSNLAGLYESMGDHARAAPLYAQALDISLANLELASAAQSERQQIAMINSVQLFLYDFLSLVTEFPAAARSAYDRFLLWRGSVTARQQATREIDDPEARSVQDRLVTITRRLASLAFATPDPDGFEAWRREIGELRAERERFQAELSRLSASYRESRRAAGATVEDIDDTLGEDTALIDIVWYIHSTRPTEKGDKPEWDARYGAFVVRSDTGPLWVPLGSSDRIDEAVVRWRESRRSTAAAGEAGQVLRELVWAPLEPHLAGATTILVAPDGALIAFPFGALPGSEAGRYLLEERSIAIVPIPQQLPLLLARAPSSVADEASLLLVGDVDYGAEPGRPEAETQSRAAAASQETRPSWSPLPNTGPEIDSVAASFARAYPESRVMALRSAEAREQRIRELSGDYTYFHVATHGFFAPDLAQPEPATRALVPVDSTSAAVGFPPGLMSGLVLAGANREPDPLRDDGVLTALEVGALDLRAELVVLSACETGIGSEEPSEGVLGLQRAFQIAGARTVVATLWSVDDARARELMERFYHNLWDRKLPRLEALRQAQISVLRGLEAAEADPRGLEPVPSEEEPSAREALPPDLWAGFVLSGDWR